MILKKACVENKVTS